MSSSENHHTERAVLAGILISVELRPIVLDQLAPSDFAHPHHAQVYAAMLDLADRGEPIDELTVRPLVERCEAPEGGWALFLHHLTDEEPTSANLSYHAELVRKESRRRSLVEAMLGAVKRAQKPGSDPDEVLGGAASALARIQDGAGSSQISTLRDVVRAEFQAIQHRFESETPPGLPTGFPELDAKLGGLHPGNLVVLAARPSMGKSSLLRNILDDVTGRQGKRGLLFSFEMTRSEVGQAMIAASAEVNLQRIRNGKIRDDEWPKLAYVLGGHLDHTRLGICDRPYLRIEDIRADTRKFAAQGGIDLLAVDYLQLITGDDRYNPNEQIARISRGLKTLGMELNIPVIAVSQLNRALEGRPNKRPQLSDLRDSGALEQDANLVLFVYRDEVYNAESPAKGMAEIIVAKNRGGPVGTIELRWEGPYTRFLSEQQQQQQKQQRLAI